MRSRRFPRMASLLLALAASGAACSSSGSEGVVTAGPQTEHAETEESETPAAISDARSLEARGTVEAAGSTIRYQTSGLVDDAAVTFLFLHGAAFTSDTWVENGILATAGEGSVQSIAIDLPGYGESTSATEANEHVVPAVIEALGLEPASTIVISPSMSGGYSLASFQFGLLDDLAGFVGVAPVGSSGFASSLDSPVPVPALAVWGDRDGSDPRSAAMQLADGFEAGEIIVIADAGHAAYNQQPAVFSDLLRNFAAGLPVCGETCLD